MKSRRRRARRFASPQSRAPRPRRQRRGVLLLVVLSLLVLFLMVGTAFVITAKQSEKAAKAANRGTLRLASAASVGELLDEVVLQLIRDTSNPNSVLRYHSLLADMYGNDGFTSAIPPGETRWIDLVPAIVVPAPTAPAETAEFTVRWPSAGNAPNIVQNVTAGQILEFDLVRFVDNYGNIQSAATRPATDNAYSGLTLTFTSGPARGVSTRIVGSFNRGNWMTLRVMAFTLPDGTMLPATDALLTDSFTRPGNETNVLVNGRPFNGTGVGLNPWAAANAPRLNAFETVPGGGDFALALMPNLVFGGAVQLPSPTPVPAGAYFPPKANPAAFTDFNGRGGGDESYDAPDYQNMALAYVPAADLTDTVLPVVTGTPLPPGLSITLPGPPPTSLSMIMPSWHRPDLLNYWAQHADFGGPGDIRTTSTLGVNPMMLRRVLMRPNWIDHPEFSGSNPEYAAIQSLYQAEIEIDGDLSSNTAAQDQAKLLLARMVYGPWDVDNDNDGIRDSVWIDAGLPVIQGPNGKLVKPMVAMLVMDMDGRLNANAHGTFDLADFTQTNPVNPVRPQSIADPTTNVSIARPPGDPVKPPFTNVPRGTGWGPADISLEPVVDDVDFRRLIVGETYLINGSDVFMPGRYGLEDDNQQHYRPGYDSVFDLMSQVAMMGWPHFADGRVRDPSIMPNAAEANRLVSAFASPPNLRARHGLALNDYGQPIMEATLESELGGRQAEQSLVMDSPYELNLSTKTAAGVHGVQGFTAADAPFSLGELERVLRVYDADASGLPSRLARLAGIIDSQPAGGGSSQNADLSDRLRLTTDSWDLPVPNVAMPRELELLQSTYPTIRRQPRSTAELFEMRVRQALYPVLFTTPPTPPGASLVVDTTTPASRNNLPRQFPGGTPTQPEPPAVGVQVRNIMRRILAPELAEGLRLNINRPLGNGRDDNFNGVVDEPGEYYDANGDGTYDEDGDGVVDPGESPGWAIDKNPNAVTTAADLTATEQQFQNAQFPLFARDVMPDGTLQNVDHRQLLARHLYVLALTLTADPQYNPWYDSANPKGPVRNTQQLEADRGLARALAQWAVNVVDFRDSDNIMTPFEYDLNPFDGWDVDDNLGTFVGTINDHAGPDKKSDPAKPQDLIDDTVVWGAEAPELVITETLAWHDRRTDDDISENPFPESDTRELKYGATDPNEADQDFDQALRPRGAAFIELLNPSEPKLGASADTHAIEVRKPNQNAPNGSEIRADLGVNLAAVAEIRDVKDELIRSPVWRMTVHKRWIANADDPAQTQIAARWDPDLAQVPFNAGDPLVYPAGPPDRSVYFGGFDPEADFIGRGVKWDNDGVAYFNNLNAAFGTVNPVPPVRPGRFMVVGSGEEKVPGSRIYESPIGDRKKVQEERPVRRIELVTMAAEPNKVRMVDSDDKTIKDPTWNYYVASPAEDANLISRLPGDLSPPATPQSLADVAIIDQVFDPQDNFDDGPAGDYKVISRNDTRQFSQRRRRFTLSEPARGYVTNFNGSKWSDAEQRYVSSGADGFPAIDTPLDGPIGGKEVLEANFDATGTPIPVHLDDIDEVLCTIRENDDDSPIPPTNPNRPDPLDDDPGATHSLIYLQRLANPLLPWNPLPAAGGNPAANGHDPSRPVNPYLTVDSNSANLTVFNSRGEAAEDKRGHDEQPDGDSINTNGALLRFASHERGYTAVKTDATLRTDATKMASLWVTELPSLQSATRQGQGEFKQGAVNQYHQMPLAVDEPFAIRSLPFHTLGFLNTTQQDRSNTTIRPPALQPDQPEGQRAIEFKMRPKLPHEWVTWNNRPYSSANELLLVPRARSSQIMRWFSRLSQDAAHKVEAVPLKHRQNEQAPFGHLSNYFLDIDPNATGAGALPPNSAIVPNRLYRVLEYVHAPSLFAGTHTWVNPGTAAFGSAIPNPPAVPPDPANPNLWTAGADARLNRQAPFNTVSERRDPGRVNLNTIPGNDVWYGLFHGRPDRVDPDPTQPDEASVHRGPDDDVFAAARRGYGDQTTGATAFIPASPSIFANPFRSPDAGDLVPITDLVRQGFDSTLLRTIPQSGTTPSNDPLFTAATTQRHNNAAMNAAFRYAPATRVGSFATTRSNVYAVWVTIGFFEVEEANRADFDAVHASAGLNPAQLTALFKKVYPDGYTLGKEDGVETGDINRLRGFYILDRTLPAGFEPGVDHNVENVIRLRRRIE